MVPLGRDNFVDHWQDDLVKAFVEDHANLAELLVAEAVWFDFDSSSSTATLEANPCCVGLVLYTRMEAKRVRRVQ